MKRILQDKKNLVILLLSILFVLKIPNEGIRFALWVLGGIFVASCSDIIINRLFYKKGIVPKSAIISGFITAGIINYNEPWFLVIIFPVLAVLSKHIIKYKNRHVFNPANFALFIAVLSRIPLMWNIESNIYLIIAFGLYIAYSIKKIPHIIGFLLFFSVPLVMQQANPLLLASWFFIFIMLIEPKTSGFGRIRGFAFGSIAGITSFLIFKFAPSYDMFVVSLFTANLFKPILERIK
ncbi:hypothetical protein HQ584_10455 [Patescibacteria group bacterium]|nr:hypothetical protein [Patescibacteria group bacterium]